MDDTTRRIGEDGQGHGHEEIVGWSPARSGESAAGNQFGDADSAERTYEIRSEIERTRGEMSETLDAIQEKLRPGTIVANATERVKSATTETVRHMADSASETTRQAMDYTREAATGVGGFIKHNQLPLALIGIGTAWLLTGRTKERNHGSGRSRATRNQSTHEGQRGSPWRSGDFDYRRTGEPDGDSPSNARDTLQRTSRRAQNQLETVLDQHPIVVGAGALVLGAMFGLIVPESEAENRMMGNARDSMIERGQEMARDAASMVEEKAGNIADVAGKIIAGQDGPPSGSEG
jgi:ElaB/YqjD/DUF883 family membrane-anchored ribosome-binding protein